MKIFSWMRSKRNEATNKPNPQPKPYGVMHEHCKEEFSDWPNGLLTIGTFGNNNNNYILKHSENKLEEEEELEQVERELRLVLNNTCPPPEKENVAAVEVVPSLERQGSVVQRGTKEIQSEKRKSSSIGKTSLSFLMKKAFLCRGGFTAAPPIIRDPLPDPRLDHSTMEKILRAMLHKKIYPQRPATPKKYLDMAESDSEEEEEEEEEREKGSHESKWVKTDSEYIVLEI